MTRSYKIIGVLRSLIVAYVITGVMLIILAFAMYKLGLGEDKVNFFITLVYILSSAIGGIVIGKTMKEKKYMWGLLLGFLYVAVICIASLVVTKDTNIISAHGISTILLCLLGGTLGGMIS